MNVPPLFVDPDRLSRDDSTGIYVRAESAGAVGSYDIATLTLDSLMAWLRSGPSGAPAGERAVMTVAMLLGHAPPQDPPQAEGGQLVHD